MIPVFYVNSLGDVMNTPECTMHRVEVGAMFSRVGNLLFFTAGATDRELQMLRFWDCPQISYVS